MAINVHKVAGRIPEVSVGPGRLAAGEFLPAGDRGVTCRLVPRALVEARQVLLVEVERPDLALAVHVRRPLAAEQAELGTVAWSRDYHASLKTVESSGRPMFLLFQEVPG